MAPTAELDLSALTSSAEIFSSTYTLPQIRAVHRSLHVAIDDKQARLRAQVGGSYRELLGTADSIVRMKGDNDDVRALLSRMGTRCGRGAVGDKVTGMDKFVATRDENETGALARLRILEECAVLMERLLRGREIWGAEGIKGKGERLQLGMKVFLVSKLVVQSFTAADAGIDDEQRAVLEMSKKKIMALRQKMIRSIDRTLETGGNGARGNEDLLCTMCAFILHASAGDRDAVQKFLQVRAKAISAASDPDDNDHRSPGLPVNNTEGILGALKSFTRTLLEVQDLVPHKLQDALSVLKKQRLLQDAQLRGIESLRLDVLQRWCSDEIQYYTPFLRHDDLDMSQTKSVLGKWADQGTDILLDGLRKTLSRMTEFKAIVDLRTRILQLWIQNGGRARGFDPSEMHESLRLALIQRLLALVDTKVSKLHLVGSEISSTLATWQAGVTDARKPLWDPASLESLVSSDSDPVGSGASALRFLNDVVSRLRGHSDVVARTVSAYDEWRAVVQDVRAVVAELRAQRWENDAEDLDEIEDEETIEERQRTLSGEDPDQLQKRMNERLGTAFEELESRMAELWLREKDRREAGPIAMYLLRVLRDIRINLPALDTVQSFGIEMVPELHATLARTVAKAPVEKFIKGPLKNRSVGVYRTLWEGEKNEENGVPVMPSPGMFGFIRDVEKGMGNVGMDLWSATAVGVIKGRMGEDVRGPWGEALRDVVEQAAEQDTKRREDAEKTEKDKAETVEPKEEDSKEETAAGGAEEENGDHKDAGDEAKEEKSDDNDTHEANEATESKESEPSPDGDASEKETLPPADNTTTINLDESDQPPKVEQQQQQQHDQAEQERKDLLVQWLFDVSYLHHFLGRSNADVQALKDEILAHAQVDEDRQRRIAKASAEYHKRTALLFGLLASYTPP